MEDRGADRLFTRANGSSFLPQTPLQRVASEVGVVELEPGLLKQVDVAYRFASARGLSDSRSCALRCV